MNVPSNSPGARATHFVGGCVCVALLVSATLPWSPRDEAPSGARGAVAGLLEQGTAPTTRADEPSRADRETVAASIASYDR